MKTLSCFSDLERFWSCKASTEIAYIKQASSHMVANRFLSFSVRGGIYKKDAQGEKVMCLVVAVQNS